jgi:hypothetical protein
LWAVAVVAARPETATGLVLARSFSGLLSALLDQVARFGLVVRLFGFQ